MTTASAPRNKTVPSYVEGLRCRECGQAYDKAPIHVCEMCFGPLEVAYDYARIGKVLTRAAIEARPASMWRYAELLPLDGPPAVGPAERDDAAGARRSPGQAPRPQGGWVKNDAVSYPTLSFKDRVVSVAVSKAREFGIGTIACASTGNLANATAAQAAAAGCPPSSSSPTTSSRPRSSAPASTARASSASKGPTTTSTGLLGDRRQVRLGVRQREPPPVLRRGVEELRLRDRRAARLAAAGARGRPDGGRLAGDQGRQGVRRVREAGPGPGPRAQDRASTAPRPKAARRSSTWCWRTATMCGR